MFASGSTICLECAGGLIDAGDDAAVAAYAEFKAGLECRDSQSEIGLLVDTLVVVDYLKRD